MYSDPVLAFKLLDKANMEEADMKQLFCCLGEKKFSIILRLKRYRIPQLKDVEYVFSFSVEASS
jgi:hypothetical protein